MWGGEGRVTLVSLSVSLLQLSFILLLPVRCYTVTTSGRDESFQADGMAEFTLALYSYKK